MKINLYQHIESKFKGSIIVNLDLLIGRWAASCSFVKVDEMLRIVADDSDGDVSGRFPFGRFKLLFWSWLDGSADAERSLGVSIEIVDGISWILNAWLFWSNSVLSWFAKN